MPFGSSQWMYNSGDNFYNGIATQSVRLDDGSSAYLAFTPGSASSATNRRKVTHSVWVKRGVLGADQTIYSANRASGGDYYLLRFSSDNKLTLILDVDAGGYGYDTSAVFRDVGAWYHVCVIIDTTQATDTDRVKIYVNGVLQDKSTKYAGGHVPQNFSTYVMDGNEDEVGRFAFTDASYFDGYMAEFITTIGQDNTISEFGELKNGVWIAKAYTGSYGTNGFRLQFNQTGTGTASSSTIGADTSGNANHWTSSGIDTEDCDMPDSPESNLATWNFLVFRRNGNKPIFSEGNTKVSGTSNQVAHTSSTIASSGKHYAEFYINNASQTVTSCGVVRTMWDGGMANSYASNYGGSYYSTNGTRAYNATSDSQTAPGSDRVGIEVDFANNEVEYFTVASDGTRTSRGGKLTSSNGIDFQGEGVFTATTHDVSTSYIEAYFSKDDWNGTPNTDYLEMSAESLPEPTISPNADTQADDYFNTVLYSGTGSTQSITGVGFQTDFSWFKRRDGATNHALYDTIRGNTNALRSNDTSTESQYGDAVVTFQSDGFQIAGTNVSGINGSSESIVSWNWKGAGIGVANTTGSINCETSANTTAGFSIVTYTGNNTSGATVGHGLSSAPEFIMFFCRTATGFRHCYHVEVGNTKALYLNATNAATTDADFLNNTTPTSSVFTLGSSSGANGGSENYVAYCFHSVEGYSKMGSYIGNGSTNGTYIYLGFKPAFLMYKRTDSSGNWLMDDNKTAPYNYDSNYLLAENSDAEGDTTTNTAGHMFDHLSNGFKMRNTNSARNASGGTYIYLAFAKNPFKYSTGR